MICEIAGFYIEIKSRYSRLPAVCKDYLCENPPRIDFSVAVYDEEIEYERKDDERYNAAGKASNGYYEDLAVFRKICAEVLKRDGFMMHGALIEYDGKGYIFTAHSGIGKTTHIRLWKQAFGEEKVTIVNGDKPILRVIDGKLYAYGTPWCGKEGYNTNKRVEMSALCFLERGEKNTIRKISVEEALPRLFSQVMIVDSADLGKQLELIDILFEKASLYELHCNMDIEAAKLAYLGMSQQFWRTE